jgi:hypothetical protein
MNAYMAMRMPRWSGKEFRVADWERLSGNSFVDRQLWAMGLGR